MAQACHAYAPADLGVDLVIEEMRRFQRRRGQHCLPSKPESEMSDEWRFAVRPGRNGVGGFIAWCARTDALGGGPLDVDGGLAVHFQFGATAEEALSQLRAEVYN